MHAHSLQLDKEITALQAAAGALQAASATALNLAARLAQAEQRQATLKSEVDGLMDTLAKEAQLGQVGAMKCLYV